MAIHALIALAFAAPALPSMAVECIHPAGNHLWNPFGDVNLSSAVNVADASCAVLYTVVMAQPGASPPACLHPSLHEIGADVNCDGVSDVSDVQLIISLALGMGIPGAVDANSDGCPDACGPCAPPGLSSCLIGGVCIPEGQAHSQQECQGCHPAAASKLWTTSPDGVGCDSAGVCAGGACIPLPGAPTAVIAVSGNGQATVSFVPDALSAGEVLDYEVQVIQTGGSVVTLQSPATVGGLINGVSYTFRVRARSAAGYSPWSEPSNAVVPSDPCMTCAPGDEGTTCTDGVDCISGQCSDGVCTAPSGVWTSGLPDHDAGIDLIVDSLGGVWATGYLQTPSGQRMGLWRHNSLGHLAAGYPKAFGDGAMGGTRIRLTPDGDFWVLSTQSGLATYAWKFDSEGELLPGFPVPTGVAAGEGFGGIAVDHEGHLWVTGSNAASTVFMYTKLDRDNGAVHPGFPKSIDNVAGGVNGWDYGIGIDVTATGNVYTSVQSQVTGTEGGNLYRIAMLRIDSAGQVDASFVAQSPSSRYFAQRQTLDTAADRVLTGGYVTGPYLWGVNYGGEQIGPTHVTHIPTTFGDGIAVDATGRPWMAAYSGTSPNFLARFYRFSPTAEFVGSHTPSPIGAPPTRPHGIVRGAGYEMWSVGYTLTPTTGRDYTLWRIGIGAVCTDGLECPSGVCLLGVCQTPACDDAVKNGSETGVDCGGLCSPCEVGEPCGTGNDCISGVCSAGHCQAPSCSDGVENGTEAGLDCGGICSPCSDDFSLPPILSGVITSGAGYGDVEWRPDALAVIGGNAARIYDLSVPSSPTLASTITGLTGAMYGLMTSSTLFISSHCYLSAYNVDVPSSPVFMGGVSPRMFQAHDVVSLTTGYLALTGSNTVCNVDTDGGRLSLVDAFEPSNLVVTADHVSAVGNTGGDSVAFGDHIVVLSSIIEVFNASNPSVLTKVGQVPSPNGTLNVSHSADIRDGYLFDARGFVMDLSNPTSPTLVYTPNASNASSAWLDLLARPAAIMTSTEIAGNYLYICGNQFFVRFDISDPTNPVLDEQTMLTASPHFSAWGCRFALNLPYVYFQPYIGNFVVLKYQ